MARFRHLSYRRVRGWPSASLKLGVGYRWPAASVAYDRGSKHGGRHAYCRGDTAGLRPALSTAEGLTFGGRLAFGGRLLTKTFRLLLYAP